MCISGAQFSRGSAEGSLYSFQRYCHFIADEEKLYLELTSVCFFVFCSQMCKRLRMYNLNGTNEEQVTRCFSYIGGKGCFRFH